VLGDLFGNQFRLDLALNITTRSGTAAGASLARAQAPGQPGGDAAENAELQVVTQVRNVARQVTTNAKRVASTARPVLSRAAPRREQRKLAAGTSTSFFVFQAQRDLAQARTTS